jgi:hypothetical protein
MLTPTQLLTDHNRIKYFDSHIVVTVVFWSHVLHGLLHYLVCYNLHFQLNLTREALTAKLHSEIILNFILKFAFDII